MPSRRGSIALTDDEQHADFAMLQDVAGAHEHAVAVVVGEGDGVVINDADEARVAAPVRAIEISGGITAGEEEHVALFHEPAIAFGD